MGSVSDHSNKMNKASHKILFQRAYKMYVYTAAAAKSLQLCPTLCHPIDGSPPGFPVPGILQARTLERFAISLSNAWKSKVKVKSLSHVQLFTTPWTAAHQAPPSMGFSRWEYWSGVPSPSPCLHYTCTIALSLKKCTYCNFKIKLLNTEHQQTSST